MPIFEYVCRECNHRFELLVQGSVEAACPECRATTLDKQFSSFGVGATGGWAPRPAEEAPVAAAEIREDREPVR